MAKQITYTEMPDGNGKVGDVTYTIPSGIDVDTDDEMDIASKATKVVWRYPDGTSWQES